MRSGPRSRSRSSWRRREAAARRSVRLTMTPRPGPSIAVRRLDEALQVLGTPVVAASQAAVAVHALLHHHPAPVIGDDEAVQVEVEAVLHRGAVDLGDEPAGPGQRGAVEADALADLDQLRRRLPGMRATPAADMQAELVRHRLQPALQRPDHAGGDAGGVPVHPHHGAEGLEPEGVGQAPQELVAAVMVDDRLGDHRAEPGHAPAEPGGHPAVMQGQIGTAGPFRHGSSGTKTERS